MNNYCPECGEVLTLGSKKCPCGWREKKKSSVSNDHLQCAYTVSNKRCTLRGTMTAANNHKSSQDTQWYCRWHFSCTSPQHGEDIIDDAYQSPIKNDSWQEDMIEAYMEVYLLTKHSDETREGYIQRMRDFMRTRYHDIGGRNIDG